MVKKSSGIAGGTWVFAYMIISEYITIPDGFEWAKPFIPLIALALSHTYLGHRLSKSGYI